MMASNAMNVGITYDLKSDIPTPASAPDDYQEEYDSPATVEAVAAVLHSLGHQVTKLGDGRPLLQRLLTDPPDFVFNFAEGQGVGRSREARVPAVLEMLSIPYTGSDPLTLAVTLDKDCAKRLVQSAGVVVARSTIVEPEDDLREWQSRDRLPYTAIVKPAWEGSSKGIRGKCVVDTSEECVAAVVRLRQGHAQPILVEEFIEGDELTVGIIGNDPPRVVGVMRVLPQRPTERFVYSLEVKRDWRRQVRYECPARLPSGQLKAIEDAALKAYRALGCRDVARVDFRLRNGIPYFLEVNPLPGLNPESGDLVILSQLAGLTYDQLIGGVFQAALDRHAILTQTPTAIHGTANLL
jgi:D-alanine-D-alanine ligase